MGSVNIFMSLVKMFSALAVVLGLMIGAMYLFKSFMKKAGAGIDHGQFIKIVSTRYLGPKSSIVLMDVLGKIVVVGIANNQMTVLTTITDRESLERLRQIESSGLSRPSLIDQLSSYRTKLSMRQIAGRGKQE